MEKNKKLDRVGKKKLKNEKSRLREKRLAEALRTNLKRRKKTDIKVDLID